MVFNYIRINYYSNSVYTCYYKNDKYTINKIQQDDIDKCIVLNYPSQTEYINTTMIEKYEIETSDVISIQNINIHFHDGTRYLIWFADDATIRELKLKLLLHELYKNEY